MHIYILPQCSTTAASVLNSAGMDAQFERSCCAISRGILSENQILHGIAEIDVLEERKRQAEEFMAWFQPAWDALGEDEKTVLTIFYLSENGKTDAIEEISERFCVERSSAYKKKDRALAHLALLLYGR